MAYYHTCPNCDAALDPGEKCNCEVGQNEMVFPTKLLMGETDCRVDPAEIFALSY